MHHETPPGGPEPLEASPDAALRDRVLDTIDAMLPDNTACTILLARYEEATGNVILTISSNHEPQMVEMIARAAMHTPGVLQRVLDLVGEARTA